MLTIASQADRTLHLERQLACKTLRNLASARFHTAGIAHNRLGDIYSTLFTLQRSQQAHNSTADQSDENNISVVPKEAVFNITCPFSTFSSSFEPR